MRSNSNKIKIATAVFGGGCFWCTEAVFKMLKGVNSVVPGYAGGQTESPTYEQVSAEVTGHAEVVQVEYDPTIISYDDLLTVFFATHDPTTFNKQGNDIGTQYRSAIYFTTDKQRQAAESFIDNHDTVDGAPIVTELKLLEKFHEAEDYHHDYFAKNPEAGYCQAIINPKILKVQSKFKKLLKRN